MYCRLSTTITVGKWLDSDAKSPFILCTTWEIYSCMSPTFLALATNVTISSSLMSLPRHLKNTKRDTKPMDKTSKDVSRQWREMNERNGLLALQETGWTWQTKFLKLFAINTKDTVTTHIFTAPTNRKLWPHNKKENKSKSCSKDSSQITSTWFWITRDQKNSNVHQNPTLPENYMLSKSGSEIGLPCTGWTTKNQPLTVHQQWNVFLKQRSWHQSFKYKQIHTFILPVCNR